MIQRYRRSSVDVTDAYHDSLWCLDRDVGALEVALIDQRADIKSLSNLLDAANKELLKQAKQLDDKDMEITTCNLALLERDREIERLKVDLDHAKGAVQRFVRGEDKLCLVCGAKEPCELKDDPASPCMFDSTPVELHRECQRLREKVAYYDRWLSNGVYYTNEEFFEKVLKPKQQLQADLDQVKAERDEMVRRNKLLRDRPDLPLERLQAYDEWIEKFDQVVGEAVGFAGIVKSTRVWADDVQQAIHFLSSPLVQSYRARRERWAVYLGASDEQVAFGGDSDPQGYLIEGQRYKVDRVVVHASKTDVYLLEYPGKAFNSVCFDLDIEADLEAWRARQGHVD